MPLFVVQLMLLVFLLALSVPLGYGSVWYVTTVVAITLVTAVATVAVSAATVVFATTSVAAVTAVTAMAAINAIAGAAFTTGAILAEVTVATAVNMGAFTAAAVVASGDCFVDGGKIGAVVSNLVYNITDSSIQR